MTRIHSLKKDKNDDTVFRHGRQKHIGTMFNEYYQRIPFFFTRDRMNLEIIGQYRGWGAFLICNGPSLASGEYDLTLLKKPGVITYGINNGPKTIRPNFWGCVDDPKRFLKSIWLDPCITKFVPHAHADKPLFDSAKWEDMKIDGRPVIVGDCPNVVYYHRNEKFNAERFLYEDTINWGNSGEFGGGRSVMIPAFRILFLLGFRRIYLLGADFKMSETYTYHFDEQRSKGAVNCNMSTYDKMKNEYFPALKPYFDAEGLQVFNCNPESELKVFPYKSYLEAIDECTMPLGDLENERTWGLYCKPEERGNWKNAPPPQSKAHLETIARRPSAPVAAYNPPVDEEAPFVEEPPRQKEIYPGDPRLVRREAPRYEVPEQTANAGDEQRHDARRFETQGGNQREDVHVKVIDPNQDQGNNEFGGINWSNMSAKKDLQTQPSVKMVPERGPKPFPPVVVENRNVPPRPNQALQNRVPAQQPVQPQRKDPAPEQPKAPKQIVNIEDEAEMMERRRMRQQEVSQQQNNGNFQHHAELTQDNNVAAYVKEKIVRAIPCGDVQVRQNRPPVQSQAKNIVLDDNGR